MELKYAKIIIDYLSDVVSLDGLSYGRQNHLFKWEKGNAMIELELDIEVMPDDSIYIYKTNHFAVLDGDYIDLDFTDTKIAEQYLWDILEAKPYNFL